MKCSNEDNHLKEILFYDRKTCELCSEKVMGDFFIKWAYQSLSGKLLSPMIYHSSFLSRLLGLYFDSPISRSRIQSTINDLEIDSSEFLAPEGSDGSAQAAIDSYRTFNQFFIRKLKPECRPFSKSPEEIVSPADGRALVYDNLHNDTMLRVKGAMDTFNSLFNLNINDFNEGKLMVIRLCPADYHRFHFPCDGRIIETRKVKGYYHSVNPIALQQHPDLFCLNKREYTIIENKIFEKVAFMEVGAFGVGGIEQTCKDNYVNKIQEKGYFKFGGSTIILVFQKDKIRFSEDLLKNSAEGYETLIHVGETIGKAP